MKKIVSILLLLTPILAYSQSGRIKSVPSESIINQLIADSLIDVKIRGVYQCENYGASTSEANNSLFIQAAIDSASANGGGIVTLLTPGVYNVQTQGSGCYLWDYCIQIKDSIDFVLGPGTTIRLADDQWNDTGDIRVMIITACDAKNFSIRGGRYDGNATGQTTWTGGYQQARGFAIYMNQVSDFLIDDIEAFNGLCCPTNFFNSWRGTYSNGYFWANGEGPEWVGCNDFNISNITVHDSTDVSVGDGFEFSVCRNMFVDNIRVTGIGGTGAGSAIDMYGSNDIVIDGFIIENWHGTGVSTNGPAPVVAEGISISNGTMIGNGSQQGILTATGNTKLNNVIFRNLSIAYFHTGDAYKYSSVSNCVFESNLSAIRIQSSDSIHVSSSMFFKNTHAFVFPAVASADQRIYATGCHFDGNTNIAYFGGNGVTTWTPQMVFTSSTAQANTNVYTFQSTAPNVTDQWVQGDLTIGAQKKFFGSSDIISQITPTAQNYIVARTLTNTATLDFPSTLAGTSSDLTITVTGADTGDDVYIGVPTTAVNANSSFSGWVSATNTVTIRFNNYSSSPIDPASGTFRATVTKY